MAQQELSSEDYEKILSFERRIHSGPYIIHHNVISLFKELFGWNLVVYSKWAEDNRLVAMITNGMSKDFIKGAHDKLLPGDTFRIYSDHIRSNKWSGIFFSQEFKGLAKKDPDLYHHLHYYNVYYFAAMVIGINPNEHYMIYKTADEGPFTDQEKMILQHLQHFLSSCITIQRNLSRFKNSLLVISRRLDTEGISCVIIDKRRNILYFSESVFQMVPREANCTQISEVTEYLIETIEDKSGNSLNQITDKILITSHGYRISAEEIPIVNTENDKETFYLLSSRPEYLREASLDRSQSIKYNLTVRETQVAELLVKGMPNKLIADHLHLSMSTVKIHNANIFRKLNVHSRLEVAEKLTKN